ncbi:CoB--CoM heterodisulfide reductase iron-sulfur subunit B family protein [Desulforudis sp. 1088]|uniref:CoB--CoM heterodisulfide reductase iron-sulfur subunit B family protein n=2 Tax=Candidatus Desulforudis TaxID=471826 RepID=UPI0034836A8B
MPYSFYPGCSMEATGKAYHVSFECVNKALDLEAHEIPDWNCCGATVVANITGDFPQLAVASRNLALAEPAGHDVLIGCSSCFVNLAWANEKFKTDPKFAAKINEALSAAGLKYNGTLRVRQLIDVLVNDVGLEKIKARVVKPLTGLKVACYTGCQTVRALRRPDFDDVEYPQMLDKIVEALGATPVPFPMAARCCGGSQQFTNVQLIYELTGSVLECAAQAGADLMVTPCPMCHMNTDVYQRKINKVLGRNYDIPVLFITQLMGVAFDCKPKELGFEYNIVSPSKVLAKIK